MKCFCIRKNIGTGGRTSLIDGDYLTSCADLPPVLTGTSTLAISNDRSTSISFSNGGLSSGNKPRMSMRSRASVRPVSEPPTALHLWASPGACRPARSHV
jgi:hypothetical protein